MFSGINKVLPIVNPAAFQARRSYILTSTALTGNGPVTNYNSVDLDNYSAFSSGVYTIPIAGLWSFDFYCDEHATSIGDFFIQRDGAAISAQAVSRHIGVWSTARVHAVALCSVGAQVRVYLDYTTTRNNYCRYQFSGYLKRGA